MQAPLMQINQGPQREGVPARVRIRGKEGDQIARWLTRFESSSALSLRSL